MESNFNVIDVQIDDLIKQISNGNKIITEYMSRLALAINDNNDKFVILKDKWAERNRLNNSDVSSQNTSKSTIQSISTISEYGISDNEAKIPPMMLSSSLQDAIKPKSRKNTALSNISSNSNTLSVLGTSNTSTTVLNTNGIINSSQDEPIKKPRAKKLTSDDATGVRKSTRGKKSDTSLGLPVSSNTLHVSSNTLPVSSNTLPVSSNTSGLSMVSNAAGLQQKPILGLPQTNTLSGLPQTNTLSGLPQTNTLSGLQQTNTLSSLPKPAMIGLPKQTMNTGLSLLGSNTKTIGNSTIVNKEDNKISPNIGKQPVIQKYTIGQQQKLSQDSDTEDTFIKTHISYNTQDDSEGDESNNIYDD